MSNGDVAYTTRDLVLRIEGKVDALQLTLGAKADRTDLAIVDARVDRLEAWRNRIFGGLVVVGLMVSATTARLLGAF